jgi:hypothetical protein
MTRILTKAEVYTLPLDVITAINNEWRAGIKEHDPKWTFVLQKHPTYDINKYICKHHPELAEQIEWEQMNGKERMIRKFGNRTTRHDAGYTGSYDGSGYDPELDPFYD